MSWSVNIPSEKKLRVRWTYVSDLRAWIVFTASNGRAMAAAVVERNGDFGKRLSEEDIIAGLNGRPSLQVVR